MSFNNPHLKLFLVCTLAILSVAFLPKLSLAAIFSHQDSINPDSVANGYDSAEKLGIFNNDPVAVPEQLVATSVEQQARQVLGETESNGEKRIAVDLTHQRLLAFEGSELKYDFLISSGTWGRTPTGTFKIWSKFSYTKMSGGSKELGTYYYLPNVPFVMFFYNDQVPMAKGYSLHGTYWHDNFGHPMSHGCINMKTEEAEKMFYWTEPNLNGKSSIRAGEENPGTKIVIYGKAPSN